MLGNLSVTLATSKFRRLFYNGLSRDAGRILIGPLRVKCNTGLRECGVESVGCGRLKLGADTILAVF